VVRIETVELSDTAELDTRVTTVLLMRGALLETGLTTVLLVTGTLLETGLTTVLLVTGADGTDSVDVLVQPPEQEVMVKVDVDRVVSVTTDPLEVVVIVHGTVVRLVVMMVSVLVVPLAGTEEVLATEVREVVLFRKPDEVLETGETGELLVMTAEVVVIRGVLDDEAEEEEEAVEKLLVLVVLYEIDDDEKVEETKLEVRRDELVNGETTVEDVSITDELVRGETGVEEVSTTDELV